MKILNVILSILIGIGLTVILNYPITLAPNNVPIVANYICAADLIFNQFVVAIICSRFFKWFDSNIKEKI